MNCHYCRASNTADDHRCQRCGRRLDDAAGPYAQAAYGRGATARALQYEPEQAAPERADRVREGEPRSAPFQPSLFSSRVVSFQSYAPEAVESKPRTRASSGRLRSKRSIPGQESFDFDTVITQMQPAPIATEPVIGCDAHVALPVHRIIAAALDLSLVIVAVALFLLVFLLAGGQGLLSLHTALFSVIAAAFFYLLYEMLWCFADLDTAGMRWARLELVTFDGRRPTRDQRLLRAASGCLSLLAAGLGVIWAFVDEESLTWHDHMSKTFPTPH